MCKLFVLKIQNTSCFLQLAHTKLGIQERYQICFEVRSTWYIINSLSQFVLCFCGGKWQWWRENKTSSSKRHIYFVSSCVCQDAGVPETVLFCSARAVCMIRVCVYSCLEAEFGYTKSTSSKTMTWWWLIVPKRCFCNVFFYFSRVFGAKKALRTEVSYRSTSVS